MAVKILIVEDNPESRLFLATLLRIEGFEVDTANDGNEAINKVIEAPPDLMITDLSMPNLTGIEMLKQLRAMPESRNIPVLAVSAYGSGKLGDAMKAGADHALRKPLDCDLLLNLIGQLTK